MCHYHSSPVFEQYVCSNELAMNAPCIYYFHSSVIISQEIRDWWLRGQCFWRTNEHDPLAKPSLSRQLLLEAPCSLGDPVKKATL